MRVIEQRCWRHVLARRRGPPPAAKEAVRKLCNELLSGGLFPLRLAHSLACVKKEPCPCHHRATLCRASRPVWSPIAPALPCSAEGTAKPKRMLGLRWWARQGLNL